MNTQLSSLFNELENNRQALFQKLDALEINRLKFKTDDSSWSILQVCHHLIVSEELSLQYLNKKLQFNTPIARANIWSSLRSFSLNTGLKLPIRFPAPKRVSQFPENLEWSDIKKRWVAVREGMEKRLSDIPDHYVNKLVYKHPSVGRLTLQHMLSFFNTHINRHVKQIDRLILAGADQDRRDH